jgi:hypothetical protein
MPEPPEVDTLIAACLDGKPFAWQTLVDQIAPGVLRTIHGLARATGRTLTEAEVGRYARRAFESLRKDNYAMLRLWDPSIKAETFLAIVVRRAMQAAESGKR